ncbi:MAG: hypothetical protein RLZZ440_1613, partial [Planctomycetota bacterium]
GSLTGAPSLTVAAGGRVTLPAGSRVSLEAGSLVVAEAWDGGLVDLGAGEIVIAPGGISAADLRADLMAGRNGGTWTGTSGITSAAAAASGGGARTLGYLTEASGATRVSYAAPGDTNLDGSVSVFDLVAVSGSGTYGTGASSVWAQGDFTYDGVTNVFDLVAVGGGDAYGRGSYFPRGPLEAISGVPEPAISAWFAAYLAGLALARRRPS